MNVLISPLTVMQDYKERVMTLKTKYTPYDQIVTISSDDGKVLKLSRSKNRSGRYSNVDITGGKTPYSIIALQEEDLITLFDSGLPSYTHNNADLQEKAHFQKDGGVWNVTLSWEWEGVVDKETCTISHGDFVALISKFKREKVIKNHFEENKKTLIDKCVDYCKVVFMLPSKVFNI